MADPPISTPAAASAATPATEPRHRLRAALILAAKLAALAVILYFVVGALIDGFRAVPWNQVTFLPGFIVLALVGMMVSKILSFCTYAVLLGPDGRIAGWRVLVAAAWVPSLGKYVPGKVAAVAWAIMLLNARRVPGAVVARSVLLQGALGIIIGLIMAVPLVVEFPEHFGPLGWVWCLALVAAGAFVLHPRVLLGLMNWVLRRLGRAPLENSLPWRTYALAAATIVPQWLAIGAAGWFIGRAIQTDGAAVVSAADLPLLISATALANCAGFLAFFAPAGLGVREGILMAALQWGGIAIWPASIIVAASRLMQVALEILLAGVGYLLLRSAGPPPLAEAAPPGKSPCAPADRPV